MAGKLTLTETGSKAELDFSGMLETVTHPNDRNDRGIISGVGWKSYCTSVFTSHLSLYGVPSFSFLPCITFTSGGLDVWGQRESDTVRKS